MSSVTRTTVQATIPGLVPGTLTLLVRDASIALDEARIPYGNCTLVVALPAQAYLEQITPYGSLRIQIAVTHEWVSPARAPQSRTYDFLLHERTVDHDAGTLTLRGETDEARLIDLRNVSSVLARTYGLSVKTAVEYALTTVGAVLEAGAVDAALTSKPVEAPARNLIPNPSLETNTTGWGASSGNFTLARVNTQANTGSWCASWTMTASADAYGAVTAAIVATPGTTYTFSYYVRSSAARSTYAQIRFLNSGSSIISAPQGTTVVTTTTGWTRVTVTAVAPAGTVTVLPLVNITGNASGNVHYIDSAMLTESTLIDYFDGSTNGGRDAGLYTAAWLGTAHASTSTLTNQPNTDATIWRPGQSLDDWLAPILQASNRRLFCDEHRKWRLVDSNYSLDGLVTISEGFNAKTGTDTMSRQKSEQGVPTWFDHVAVHYTWTDAVGAAQEKWDFAAAGSVKGFTLEIKSPWPGAGAAAAILARANGRGRTQDVSALSDYLATPGMPIVTTLPGTPIQSGVLSSVVWRWSADADEMSITSRGLTNTPAGAWLFAVGPWSAATGPWSAVAGSN